MATTENATRHDTTQQPCGTDTDAAMVLGMASTALPFARTREAEAERWLRILRLSGQAGVALQALGVSEAPLESSHYEGSEQPQASGEDMVVAVSAAALDAARGRGAHTARTSDVLIAVMQVYGEDFDRVLHVHGTDRDEVLQRLAAGAPSA
jgi:hypothetical protein